MKVFLLLLPQFLEDFFQKVLVGFAEYAMALPQKPFVCTCCGNDTDFVRKTRHGKATTILTLGYGDVLENLTNTILSATTLPCPALLALTFQTSFST
jgi:hypothetical protein